MKLQTTILLILSCSAMLFGQTPAKVDDSNADLAITANVRARELRFEQVPNPNVEFTGTPERETLWEAERENLPKPVQPGVTYRNIGIRLRIASRFADIERIVAEALGEISAPDEPAANDSLLINPPSPNKTPPQSTNQSPVQTSSPPRK